MAEDTSYELAFQVDRLMRRMNAGVQARVPIFDKERIGPIGGMILMTLSEIEPAPMQRLVETMNRDKAQLSRTISMLERRELVRRSPNEADQRSNLLTLTDKGSSFVEEIKGVLADVIGELLIPLDTTERAAMLSLLSRL